MLDCSAQRSFTADFLAGLHTKHYSQTALTCQSLIRRKNNNIQSDVECIINYTVTSKSFSSIKLESQLLTSSCCTLLSENQFCNWILKRSRWEELHIHIAAGSRREQLEACPHIRRLLIISVTLVVPSAREVTISVLFGMRQVN